MLKYCAALRVAFLFCQTVLNSEKAIMKFKTEELFYLHRKGGHKHGYRSQIDPESNDLGGYQ